MPSGEQIYPREPGFRGGLGLIYMALGQHELALKEHQEGSSVFPPYDSVAFRFVAYTYVLLNRVEDAAATAREAHAKGLDSDLGPTLYLIAFYRNDSAEMARRVTGSAGTPGEEDLLLALEADTAAYFGHLGKSSELSRRAANSVERAGENETSATFTTYPPCGKPCLVMRTKPENKPDRKADFRLGVTNYGFRLPLPMREIHTECKRWSKI